MEIPKNLKGVSGIYRILNTNNGRSYIGSSKDIYARLREHRHMLQGGWHENRELAKEFNEIEGAGFIFKMMYPVECLASLKSIETHFVLTEKNPYNKRNPITMEYLDPTYFKRIREPYFEEQRRLKALKAVDLYIEAKGVK